MNSKKRITKLMKLAIIMFCLTSFPFMARAAAEPGGNEVRQIVKKASASVVRVEVRNGFRRIATGVVIDKDGYIATTALISPRGEKVRVINQEGQPAEADFLGFDPESRIAFLQVKEKKLPAIAMGRTADLAPGSWVCALGISPDTGIQVTQGIVSSLAEDRLRLNIWMTPGMSGGPVLNEKGQLVGLLRGVYAGDRLFFPGPDEGDALGGNYFFERIEPQASGMAMAITVEMLNDIFKDIKTKGKVERGWLGISITENAENQVIITDVEDESPAALAKLQEGDRIIKINSQEIKDSDQLISEIRSHHPGEKLTLLIDRQGKQLEVEVRLGNLPEEEAFRELELRFPEIFRPLPPPGNVPLPPKSYGQRFEFGLQNYKLIGISLEQLNPDLSRYFGVTDGRGLLVTSVSTGSPAEKADLRVGDVIIGADGERVESLRALSRFVGKKKKGDKLALEIVREKKKMKIEIEIPDSILNEGRD
ncbi:MAG: PDZ domain-containing protein [Acidobacteriota bacterium]|nr:PDZ domain-containing protein [Acidobacteriota bacterium]